MDLKQRRAAKEFQDTRYPDLLKQIHEAVGFEVEVLVDWETLCEPQSEHLYAECWTNLYFTPLIAAFKDVCKDEMGKEALQEQLNKIHIFNRGQISSKHRAFGFADGTLTYDHKPCTNVPSPSSSEGQGDVNYREAVKAIVDVLESKL